ncbi:MAG: hypothetical protein E6I83_07590 [Chloroflexi bacterium]|nr:MAG: hypothetical protein E6I83_07590 [Chloroflexota bacterium]
MRPFRSRVLTALVMAILSLGLLGTVAFADEIPTQTLVVDPAPTVIEVPATVFPEDPWGLPTLGFPEDPWPDL